MMPIRTAPLRAGIRAQRAMQLRLNSTSTPPPPPSSSASSSKPSSSQQPDFWQPHPRRSRSEPPSKHSLLYREIYPPFLRCIAYGSGAYFALHLLWTYLDGEEQTVVEGEQRAKLEDQVREARLQRVGATSTREEGGGSSQAGGSGSWWKVWSR